MDGSGGRIEAVFSLRSASSQVRQHGLSRREVPVTRILASVRGIRRLFDRRLATALVASAVDQGIVHRGLSGR